MDIIKKIGIVIAVVFATIIILGLVGISFIPTGRVVEIQPKETTTPTTTIETSSITTIPITTTTVEPITTESTTTTETTTILSTSTTTTIYTTTTSSTTTTISETTTTTTLPPSWKHIATFSGATDNLDYGNTVTSNFYIPGDTWRWTLDCKLREGWVSDMAVQGYLLDHPNQITWATNPYCNGPKTTYVYSNNQPKTYFLNVSVWYEPPGQPHCQNCGVESWTIDVESYY